ncbi:DUF943 family protein [Pseudescherichia vulneris]|uniref:DUF943 family protein n=1 Tax=Pseudescherichia vulneris TaxID=566 RepID=UPI0005A78D84|nr:DUF943 family protein [Pseudescherichia vulneris]STQ56487.1 Enterobacterial putative membrane protein (DUF943) [Pseudescherichia vulneris]
MKSKNNKILLTIFIVIFILIAYFFWRSLRPVDIVGVHKDGSYSYLLVKDFPITAKGQINWWLKNSKMLKNHYDIPKPDSDGDFGIVVWDFGEGYKEQGDESKDDRFCFADFKSPKNCIDKNMMLYITYTKSSGISFITHNEEYRINKKGELVKDGSD